MCVSLEIPQKSKNTNSVQVYVHIVYNKTSNEAVHFLVLILKKILRNVNSKVENIMGFYFILHNRMVEEAYAIINMPE